MAVKYRVQYTSVNGIDYQLDISNPDYVSTIIEIEGSVLYQINDIEDISYPIRSKNLEITLKANLDETLEDLFTNAERYWRVDFYRDSNKIFFGYLTSENTPNDFSSDQWEINIDALCPMGFLDDMGYVDLAGSKYSGKEETIKVIANCLKRGFELQTEAFNILSYEYYDYRIRNSDASYTVYTSGNMFADTETFQDVFNDDDSGESQSCLEVLKKILDSLQCTITQINGDTWLISHYLYDSSTVPSGYINSYDKDGNGISDLALSPFSTVTIKTDSSTGLTTDIVHVSKDQSFFWKRGFDKIVANTEYQYRESILDNSTFDGGTTGVSMPNWTSGGDYSYATSLGYLRLYRYDSGHNSDALASFSDSKKVLGGQKIKANIVASTNYSGAQLSWNIKITSSLGSEFRLTHSYTLSTSGYSTQWTLTSNPVTNRIMNLTVDPDGNTIPLGEEVTIDFEIPPLPFSASTTYDMEFELYAAMDEQTYGTTDYIDVLKADIVINEEDITGFSKIGELDTARSLDSEKYDLYLSTKDSEITYNQLYKLTQENPIVSIVDKFRDTSQLELNSYHVWNRLITFKLKRVFSGSFYNFYEPHKIVEIEDLSSNDFKVIEYSFDTYNNIGYAKLEENETSTVAHTQTESDVYKSAIEPKIE